MKKLSAFGLICQAIVNMNKRTSLARSIKYQRRHYHSNPRPQDQNLRDRNVTCLIRAAHKEGAHSLGDYVAFIKAIDAMPKDYQSHHQPR